MVRNLRQALKKSSTRRRWLQVLGLTGAVAGLVVALGVSVPPAAHAQEASGTSMSVPLAPDAPDEYVVKKGDTLWDISAMFLRDPWYWPEIWYVNPEIANPHLIYPGDVLHLVYIDGKPRITMERGSTVHLSPQIRSEPLESAIRPIPYDLLMDFVGRPQIISKDDVKGAPYVVGIRDRHMVGSTENEVYGYGMKAAQPDERFTILHIGDQLRDPDDGDLLGYMAYFAGTGEVVQSDNREGSKDRDRMAHLKVVEAGREILQGDKLFPAQADIGDPFVPSAPSDEKLDGQVIAIHDGVYAAGRYQVLALNRGKKHGLVPGNVVAIFQRGEEVRNRFSNSAWRNMATNYEKVRLPSERNASVMVFKVYDRMSYGLVVESTSQISVGDFVKHPNFGHRDTGLSNYVAR
jgi:LysM domain